MSKRFSTCRRATTAFALAGGALASACAPGGSGNADSNFGDESVLNLPVVPRPTPPMDRAALLAAVARAASAVAAGRAPDPAQRALDGRPFELRIRFGCKGPAPELAKAWLGWSYDPEDRTVRVRAAPTIAADDPLVASLASGEVEAVEGFWLPRPWLLEPVCPARPAADAPEANMAAASAGNRPAADDEPDPAVQEGGGAVEAVPQSPRVGVAQFFSETDARTGRRDGRAYESVRTLPKGQSPSESGFVLILSGRLRAIGSMGVIGCSARSSDAPPECVVSAEFDRVRIEEPESGREIAEWRSS